jgi:hypothetical protein
MFALCRQAAKSVAIVGLCLIAVGVSQKVHAEGNIVMAFDALMVNNSANSPFGATGSNVNFGGYGMFTYDGMVISGHAPLGRFGAWELRKDGAGGSGMGFNFNQSSDPNNPANAGSVFGNIGTGAGPVQTTFFPLLDRSGYGINFDPTQYVAELVYKPLPGNNGDQLNMTLDTFDGFDEAGYRRAEQWQWNFLNLAIPTGTPDADGFYTVRSNGGSLAGENAGYGGIEARSFMFSVAPLPVGQEGDDLADLGDFEAFDDPNVGGNGRLAVPNGAHQIHLQTPYDDVSTVDNFAVKAVRIIKLAPDDQEVVRMDGRSGFSLRFGTPMRRALSDPAINIGGTNYIPSEYSTAANTNQVSRFDQNGFTNIVLNTHDDVEVGGLGLYQPPNSVVFDGTTATFDVTAKLTVPLGAGQADRIVLVLKDKDGNDTAAGQGGEEYHYDLLLNQFNTSTMTTVSVPLTDFTALQAGEFVNTGDGSLADFNLYHIGLETVIGIGVVDLEIESMRVMLPAPPGVPGDYNDDGTVDAADYADWRKHNGTATTLPNDDTPGNVGADDYTRWMANFGNTAGSGAAAGGAGAVPEPASSLLVVLALGILAAFRRQAH